MKTTKRLLSCLLVLAMLFALAIPAFAADNVTITVKSTKANATYTLYKLFAADYVNGTEATYLPGNITEEQLKGSPFTIDAGHVVLKDPSKTAIVDADKDWFLKTGTTLATVQGTEGQSGGHDLKWTVQPGYYFLVKTIDKGDGTTETMVTNIATAGASITINDKNSKDDVPGGTPEDDKGYKWIQKKDAAGNVIGKEDVVMAAIGEELDFTIEFKTVNYVARKDAQGNDVLDETTKEVIMDPITQYTITDVPNGLTVDFGAETTEVIVGATTLTTEQYTVSSDGHTITIDWNVADHTDPSKITVNYKGTVTKAGAIDDPITNDVTLKYKANNKDKEIPDPDPENPETKIYSSSVRVLKVDGSDQTVLENAVFALINDKGDYLYYNEGKVEWIEASKAVLSGNGKNISTVTSKATADGKDPEQYNIEFTGLGDGKYQVVEIQAPAGYNGSDEPSQEMTTSVSVGADKKVTITNGWTKVENNKGTTLPSTGGIGTTMFYVVGGLLVAAAVVVLVSKKRMGAEQ